MEYTIIAVQALGSFANWEKKASPMLAQKVNAAMREGWQPIGGVCSCGDDGITLMQAMVRRVATAVEATQ